PMAQGSALEHLATLAGALRAGRLLGGWTVADEELPEPPPEPPELRRSYWIAWVARHPYVETNASAPPVQYPLPILLGDEARQVPKPRKERLEYHWPGGRWPAACAVFESKPAPAVTTEVSCRPSASGPRGPEVVIELSIRSQLCATCDAVL